MGRERQQLVRKVEHLAVAAARTRIVQPPRRTDRAVALPLVFTRGDAKEASLREEW